MSASRESPHLEHRLHRPGSTPSTAQTLRSGLLAVPWMRPCDLTVFSPPSFPISLCHLSHINLYIYVCQLCSLPHFCYCIALKKSSLSFYSHSRPSGLWKATYGHYLHSRIVSRCSLWLLCGDECCCGAAARAAGLAWLPACGTVGGFVSSQVCAGALRICKPFWWSGDAALFCNDLWCNNAPHTPSSRGEADVPLAYQSSCAVSWAKGMK